MLSLQTKCFSSLKNSHLSELQALREEHIQEVGGAKEGLRS